MVNDQALFLGSPNDIEKEIRRLIRGSISMKIAVAFIGQRYWRELFDGYRGELQVICWLKSPGTNPYAVEEMRDAGIRVKQIDSMHAKVYLVPGGAAIVGSANLSEVALGETETAGRHEAAVLLKDDQIIKEIGQWFNRLWDSKACVEITDGDLGLAKVAFDARAREALEGGSTASTAFSPTAVDITPAKGGEIFPSPIKTQQPRFTPIIGMPVKENGRPLYGAGSDIAGFFMLFTGSGGVKSDIIAQARGKSEPMFRMILDKHCDAKGREGLRWDIAVDGKLSPFLLGWFDALAGSARIQFVNLRKSDFIVNKGHRRGQNYRS